MEKTTKRIIAIVIIVTIASAGIGAGVWWILLPEEVKEQLTNPYEYPGFGVEQKPLSQTIKVGVLDDFSNAYGQLSYYGAYLKAVQINLAGGLNISGTTYYIGLTFEDTMEAAFAFIGSGPAIAAALRMIEKDPHVIIGGFRSDAVEDYVDHIMAAEIPFIGTGASLKDFCWTYVKDDSWPYFFRVMPQNSYWLGNHTTHLITDMIIPDMLAKGIKINKTTIIYEDFVWTVEIRDMIIAALLDLSATTPGVDLSSGPAGNITASAVSPSTSELQFDALWEYIKDPITGGDQLVIPIISDLGTGRLFGHGYNISKPNCIVAGINVAHQMDDYMEKTGGGGVYEISFAGTMRAPVTPFMIPFWDAYVNMTTYDPVYTSVGCYEAIMLIANATVDAQSLVAADIVASLEKLDENNPLPGPSSLLAFDQYHDALTTIPGVRPDYRFPLFIQYNQTGGKEIIPSAGGYSPSLETSPLLYPDWWSF